MVKNEEDKAWAGQMSCANSEIIYCVKIVNSLTGLYVNKFGKKANGLTFDFILDCCGAGGQYYDICDAL